MQVKIVDVDQSDWYSALGVANRFLRDYPNRPIGFHNLVVYFASPNEDETFIVYKTKTSIVVRGTKKKE